MSDTTSRTYDSLHARRLGLKSAIVIGVGYDPVGNFIWGWRKSARLGNGCGAIVVTKHGCANFMPTYDEVMAFVGARGGL